MIPKAAFGRTGHISSRVIFGSWALSTASQKEADQVVELLMEYGINHIDTAPMYGNAEKLIGTWMKKHRQAFFLATKTRKRTHHGALADLNNSLQTLGVDSIDLLQLHGLTNMKGWEDTMGTEGALEVLISAREQGKVRHLGVTGHSNQTPAMHKRSLERYDFDSVMLPYSYRQMKIPAYAADFADLITTCRKRKVAVQTIKSIARGPWNDQLKTFNTYFYEPLVTEDAIQKSVHWVLGLTDCFLITAGDIQLLPKILRAASIFEQRPSDAEMESL
ncbi:MAG: aldo/keto reductase, partial [Anaerolineae bacterium]|nr:aldo/keto reductase [Anaerolineae bacterium]